MFNAVLVPMLLGFAVFLIGMKLMELALHRAAGPYLNRIIERSTATPIHSLAVGTISSAFLQSSTAVTVIAISMVNARLLTFGRTLGIILGTNIGTCLTTEIIGLQLDRLALPLLVLSLLLWFVTVFSSELRVLPFNSRAKWIQPLRTFSVVLGGFALLLTGMAMMQAIGPAAQQSELFGWFMEKANESLLWGLLAGTVLTAFMHSSAAVIGIIMGFAAIGAMPVELCIAVVFGANIGTCATALIASIGGTRSGQFVAMSHVILNVGGALLFLPFIHELAYLSELLSSTPSSQIARAQTLFNVICSLIALPICYLPQFRRH